MCLFYGAKCVRIFWTRVLLQEVSSSWQQEKSILRLIHIWRNIWNRKCSVSMTTAAGSGWNGRSSRTTSVHWMDFWQFSKCCNFKSKLDANGNECSVLWLLRPFCHIDLWKNWNARYLIKSERISSIWHYELTVTRPDEIPTSAKSSGWCHLQWYCIGHKSSGWESALN